jgi:hypothetical protein
MFFNFLIALTLFSSVYGGGWYSGINVNTVLTVASGATANEVWGAGYSNTKGGILTYSADRGNGPAVVYEVGGINLDVAVSRDGNTVALSGPSGVFYGPATTSFSSNEVTGQWTSMVSQNIEQYGNSGFAAVGRFAQGTAWLNGVAVANSASGDWIKYDIGLDPDQGYFARYGSFPSDNTWYVTSGDWPNQSDAKLTNGVVVRATPRISVYYNSGDGKPEITFISARHLMGSYIGAVSKTTDGGATWTKVFDSVGDFTLNQIDCFTENFCVTVGENGKKAVAMKTTDGGATWTTIMTLSGNKSLHAVKMISHCEYFIAGGEPSSGPFANKEIVGDYWHTKDEGKHWTKTAYNGYGFDMDFKDGSGYAAAIFKKHTDVWYYH